MSHFPSPSPRRSNSPTNPSSRIDTYDQPTHTLHTLTSPLHSFVAADPQPSTSAISSSRTLRPPSDTSPGPMSRRLRRHSPHRQEASASRESSSDSQGGMADTEEGDSRRHSHTPTSPTNPPKKKRTRTLTTPHQSAVLHALLAQSRFPTTAMREEVGRSIGLSARKVQIWFQNQRQKARRPRQGEAPLPRPPQYGPYPTMEGSSSAQATGQSEPSTGTVPQVQATYPRLPSPYEYQSGPRYGTGPERSSELLGPGVPGLVGPSSMYSQPQAPQRHSPTVNRYPMFPLSPREIARPYPSPYSRHSVSPTVHRSSDSGYTPVQPLPYEPLAGQRYILRRTPSPSRTLPLPIPTHPTIPLHAQWDPTRLSPTATRSDDDFQLSPIRTNQATEQFPLVLPRIMAEHRRPAPPSEGGPTRSRRPAGRYDPVRSIVVPYRDTPGPPSPPADS